MGIFEFILGKIGNAIAGYRLQLTLGEENSKYTYRTNASDVSNLFNQDSERIINSPVFNRFKSFTIYSEHLLINYRVF
jgi:hypothetical protein